MSCQDHGSHLPPRPSSAFLAWRQRMASIALQNAIACAQAADSVPDTVTGASTLREQYLDASDRWMRLVVAALAAGRTSQIGTRS